jgi:hypothetical protein
MAKNYSKMNYIIFKQFSMRITYIKSINSPKWLKFRENTFQTKTEFIGRFQPFFSPIRPLFFGQKRQYPRALAKYQKRTNMQICFSFWKFNFSFNNFIGRFLNDFDFSLSNADGNHFAVSAVICRIDIKYVHEFYQFH